MGATVHDLRRDLTYGVRTLRRSPGFTAAAVVALGLGMGATTAVFSLVNGVLLRPLPYGHPSELVELRELGGGRRFYPSFPNFQDWRAQAAAFDGMVAVQPLGATPVLDAGDPFRASVLAVSRGFLSTLQVSPFLGRDFTDEENVPGGPDAALVSHRFWETHLGARSDLSSATFTAFGSTYRAVGVLPPGFDFLYDADVYVSADRWPGTVRSAHAYRVVGRLAPGVSRAVADQEMDALAASLRLRHGGNTSAESVEVRPLADVLLGAQRRPLALLLLASGLVLLVACANVAGTLLARGQTRRRELAVRTALGAGRGRLVRQLLTESLLLAVVSGIVGTALAWLGLTGAVSLAPDVLPRMESVGVDGRALGFTACVTVGTAFVFGLWPALRLSRARTAAGLKEGGRGGAGGRTRAWSFLIAGEVGLAVVLLVGAGLLVRSLLAIVSLDAGWDPHGVLQVSVTPPAGVFASEEAAVAYVRSAEADLASLPGVQRVGLGTFGPLDAGNWTAPARDADTGESIDGFAGWRLVDAGYFGALRVPLLRGRLFEATDGDDVAVVNESLARRLWGDGDPIGRRVSSNFDRRQVPLRVIGVVRVARDWRFDDDGQMELFVPWWSRTEQVSTVKILVRTAGEPTSLIPVVRETLRSLEPRVPVEFTTLEAELSRSTADRRFVAAVLVAFAGAGLLLALVGIFGVVAYTVAQRRRELGIRMALGAGAGRVRADVRRQVLVPAGSGLVVGLVSAALLSRFMQSLLYGTVQALDPWVLGGVAVCFALAALLASDLPARRTTRIDPASVLRSE